MPKNANRVVLFVTVNAVALIVAVAVLEVVGASLTERPTTRLVGSWRFNHTWRPKGNAIHDEWIRSNPEYPKPYQHEFNDQGWLERYDVPLEKPLGTFRIFYLGDSFVEGTAPMEGSVPSLVETALNDQTGQRDTFFEVINTGTSSYSPLLEYVLIRHRILEYDPDLIVVVVDMTDDFDDWKYRKTAIYDSEGNPEAVPPRNAYLSDFIDTAEGPIRATFLTRLQLFLYRHSNFYSYLLSRNEIKQPRQINPAQQAYPRWAWCREQWDDQTKENVDRMFDVIRRMARLCKRHGVRLALVTVPHYPQFSGRSDGTGAPMFSDRPHRELCRLATEMDVPCLNSYEALREAVHGTPQHRYYYRQDMHFNPEGYKIWAKAHAEFLMDPKNELLP